ncbi:hypothetical protein KJ966_21070 [bacterium]|nr:hypothetical protein [bacterium]
MVSSDWWHTFLRHTKAIKSSETGLSSLTEKLSSTLRLFHLFQEEPAKLKQIGENDLRSWISKPEALYKELQYLELQTGNPTKRAFYASFAKAVDEGIGVIKENIRPEPAAIQVESKQQTIVGRIIKTYKAATLGKALTDFKRRYTEIMEAQLHASQAKGLKNSTADEADRLQSFLAVTSYWLQRHHALEYAFNVLNENLNLKEYPIDKEPLPLQFRLEQSTSAHIFRLVRANAKKPYPEDRSILDIINDCHTIPVHSKGGNQVVEDPEVIRFLRLHSQENKLGIFKNDNLSQIAQQMYYILVNTLNDIDQLSENVISAINLTPLSDLEYAFSDINPEECRSLLRRKFQSLLPGINEQHRLKQGKPGDKDQSTRTFDIMEDYNREFQKEKEVVLSNPKPAMATAYWLRRMLTAVIKNNFSLEQKDREHKSGTPAMQKHSQLTLSRYFLVGTSITIGEDDIANFHINPDDVKSSELSIQRVDRTDKWIAVRKSEKTHRILKKDFFSVTKDFIEKDLNPALVKFGFDEIDLNNQLLPEIHERLADEQRIETIRSAILGTIITNLEEFRKSEEFHATLRRYFKKPTYNNLHYPENEKLALVAKGLAHSSTSILQMKFRRVLKVKEEITDRLHELQAVIETEPMSRNQAENFQEEFKLVKSLMGILNKIQQIMIYARPSLKDVKLQPDSDIHVFKATNGD